jgi:hypothetical protein
MVQAAAVPVELHFAWQARAVGYCRYTNRSSRVIASFTGRGNYFFVIRLRVDQFGRALTIEEHDRSSRTLSRALFERSGELEKVGFEQSQVAAENGRKISHATG